MNEKSRENLTRQWIINTTLGAMVGVVLAVTLFPSAAFGMNPIGVYGSNVLGFSLCLALPFAISQWLTLRRFLKALGVSKKLDWIWVLVSTLGIVATVLPLWSLAAAHIIWLPVIIFIPLFPGSALLGITQCFFLAWIFGWQNTWMWTPLTIIGVILGAIFSLFAYYLLGFILGIPIDIIWFTGTALFISMFQSSILNKIYKIYSRQ